MRVMIGVFVALGCAGVAHISAKLHVLLHKLRTPGFKATTKGADIGAVTAELDTGGHVVMLAILIAHLKAGCYAAFAGFGTLETGISVAVRMIRSNHSDCWFTMKN